MPHEINFLPKDRLILVRRYGEIDIDDMRLSLKGVVELSEKQGVKSALIDTREISSFPTVDDIYNFSINLPYNIWFALVLPVTKTQQHANVDELDKIFVIQESINSLGNIGRDHSKLVRVFKHYEDALKWLKKNA